MKHRLAMMGLQIRGLLVYAVIAVCVIAVGAVQLPQWGRLPVVDMYPRLLSVQIGMVISFMYAILQAKPVQQLLLSSVSTRFSGRLSLAGFILLHNLCSAVLAAASINLAVVVQMKSERIYVASAVPQFLLSVALQILYLFVLAALQQIVYLLVQNWYAAFSAVVLFSSADFLLSIMFAAPSFVGWGLTLQPWYGSCRQAAIVLLLLSLAVTVAFTLILSRVDLLNYNRRASK